MAVDIDYLRATFGLENRVALITGASSGIGAHAARVFARAGCAVILTARRAAKLAEVARAVEQGGGEAMVQVMDVTERDSVAAAIDEAAARFGRIDLLLNNAGIAASERFIDMSEAAWREVIEVDLTAVWRVGQLVARQMIAQGGGAIINVASILGRVAQSGNANYGAAKAGVIHLTESMALELAGDGVRVNAIAPGYFSTDINRNFLESAHGKKYLANLLPKRAGALHELDGALLLLASATYINGAVLTVDGGTLLRGV